METRQDLPSSKKTLIFALGSAHGDDQIGWRVAERLAATIDDCDASLRAARSPGELLDCLEGVDRLIVCDACQNMGSRGAVHCWRWPGAPLQTLRSAGSHDLTLAAALALAEQLRLLPAEVVIFGVEGELYLSGPPLDAQLGEAVDRVVEAIARILASEITPKRV